MATPDRFPCARSARGGPAPRRARAIAPGLALAITPGLVLALVLALSSCAPVATVPTVDAPNGEARVAPGTSFRVGFTFGYAEFGLTPGDLDPLPLPEIVARERESVRRAFSLRSAEAPAGWRVSLADVVRVVEPIGAGSRTYHLEVLVQIDVPADAPTGRHPVIATVRSRNGVERDVSLEVEVTGGEGR